MSNDIRDILARLNDLESRVVAEDAPTASKQTPALLKVVQQIEESHMSNIDQLMQDIGTGEVDIYDIYAHPGTPEEEYASKIVNKMYDDVVIDQGLHPDDDFEKILDIVADQIAHDYPADTLNEGVATEEKLLDKLKSSLKDYLATAAEKYVDQDLKDKVRTDLDLGKKDRKDHDIFPKPFVTGNHGTVKEGPDDDEDDDQRDLPSDEAYQRGESPYDAPPPQVESAPVKTITMEDGRMCEIHGDEHRGFEIRHGNRSLPTRFKRLAEAELALEMFLAHRRHRDESADYLDEK